MNCVENCLELFFFHSILSDMPKKSHTVLQIKGRIEKDKNEHKRKYEVHNNIYE